jgi:hypothetical protein
MEKFKTTVSVLLLRLDFRKKVFDAVTFGVIARFLMNGTFKEL